MNSAAAALVILALGAGPGAQRTGSTQFQVSARVVAPMRASAPSFAELGPAGADAQPVNASLRESPGARRAGGEPVVARVFPTASRRGDAPAALIGLLGGASRRCADTGACEVSLARVAATAADTQMLVVTLLPDGAPLALVER